MIEPINCVAGCKRFRYCRGLCRSCYFKARHDARLSALMLPSRKAEGWAKLNRQLHSWFQRSKS